jgi:NHLM bacteriocin system secretion protein
VVEMLAMNGDTVKENQPILSVESGHTLLHATIYLRADSNAKLLRPGMEARISPVTSRSERHGYVLGKVQTVSKYPATEAGMMALLNNAALVRDLSASGPPIAIGVAFDPDPGTRSGFRWSSSAGAALELSSGTLCTGTFIVESHRPIGFLFPMLLDSTRVD